MQASVNEDREKYIGGSDIPIIMGISPFKTRWQLVQEKAGLIKDEFEGNEYTEYGNIMEPKIRDFINESEKDKFVEGKHINGNIRCHTDGENKTTILEIKTTSDIHESINDYKTYLVQLLFYIENTGRKKGKLAVYPRPKDFNEEFNKDVLQLFDIKLNDYNELVKNINQAVESFIRDVNRVKENPFLTEQDLLPTEIIELSKQVEKFEMRLKDAEIIKKKYEEVKQKLFEKMGEYNIKKWETPNNVKITRIEPTETKIERKKQFDEEKFKEDKPALYEEYLTTVDKLIKGKKGYVRITLPKELQNDYKRN